MIAQNLTIFRTAAAVGSFTEAAKRLNMSQPNVTQRIAALERELGTPLFFRDGRRVELTPAGEVLRTECERLFAAEGNILRKVRSAALRKRAFLLGGTATAGSFLLPGLLTGYRRRYPDRVLYFKPGTHDALRDMLFAGELDLAMTECAAASGELLSEPYCRDRLIPVLAPGYLQKTTFSLRDHLRKGGSLIVANAADRAALTDFLNAHGIFGLSDDAILEAGSFDAARQLAQAGAGPALLSDLAVETELKAGVLRAGAFAEGEIFRGIDFLYAPGGDQAFIRDFIRCAIRHKGRSLHELETHPSRKGEKP